MHRYRRVSRPLIAALGVTIVLGLSSYLYNVKRAHAAERDAREAKLAQEAKQAQESKQAQLANAPPEVVPPPPAGATATAQVVAAVPVAPVVPAALITQTPGLQHDPAPAVPATQPARPLVGSIFRSDHVVDAAPHLAAVAPALSGAPLADAKAKKDAGDLVAARSVLNDALLTGKLGPADVDAAHQSILELNQTLVFSPKRFPNDPFASAYTVQSGEHLSTIAAKNGVTWELLARVNNLEPRRLRSGTTIKVLKGPFHAVVSKSKFRMDVYLGAPGDAGSVYVSSYAVGLGKDGSTPTGTWQVEPGNKIRHPKYYSPRGEGVIDADDPKNPLGGYWIGLAGLDGQAVGKNSYGVHGTIDPNSIGKQESMGCIRLKAEDIALVFDLLVEGKSKVVIKD